MHTARTLPPADADPIALARSIEARAEASSAPKPEPAVDALCEAALTQHPGHAAITTATAHWYLATDRPEQAMLVCEEAFGHNAAGIRDDRAVQAAWGEALLALDRAQEAVWHLSAACTKAGANPDDWARLAQAQCRCGSYSDAIASAREATLRPWAYPASADDACATMATAHYCLGQMAEAEGILEELLARSPRHAEGRKLLHKVRNFMGKGMKHDS